MSTAIADYTDRASLLQDMDTLLLLALDDILHDVTADQLAAYVENNPGVKLLLAIAGKLQKLP